MLSIRLAKIFLCYEQCTPKCVPDQHEKICSDGSEPYDCLIDPCEGVQNGTRRCPAGRQRVAEYCGGCNYGCLFKKPWPTGKSCRLCVGTANLCNTVANSCTASSVCVPDQCNDCAAVCIPQCGQGYLNRDTARCERCKKGYACKGYPATPKPCHNKNYAPSRGLAKCERCPVGTTTPAKPIAKGFMACRPALGLYFPVWPSSGHTSQQTP